jgi:transposase-like protein
MTCYVKITCPQCKNDRIMKAGRNARGEQRYRCQNPSCPTKTFMLSYRYRAYEPGIKDQVVAMAINGSGIRDTGRVLGIDKQTVMATLKKSEPPCAGQPQNPRAAR